MIPRLSLPLALLIVGCGHRSHLSHTEAEAERLARHASRMTQGCDERFEDRKAPYTASVMLARNTRCVGQTTPTVVRSQWSADLRGRRWTVETSCNYAGIRQMGQPADKAQVLTVNRRH